MKYFVKIGFFGFFFTRSYKKCKLLIFSNKEKPKKFIWRSRLQFWETCQKISVIFVFPPPSSRTKLTVKGFLHKNLYQKLTRETKMQLRQLSEKDAKSAKVFPSFEFLATKFVALFPWTRRVEFWQRYLKCFATIPVNFSQKDTKNTFLALFLQKSPRLDKWKCDGAAEGF